MCPAFLIAEKVEVFLEVFGNSEIRNQTEEILKYAATQLSLSVSDMLSTELHPCLDTGLLKVREVVFVHNLLTVMFVTRSKAHPCTPKTLK